LLIATAVDVAYVSAGRISGCQLHISAGDRPALTAVIEGHRGLVTLS